MASRASRHSDTEENLECKEHAEALLFCGLKRTAPLWLSLCWLSSRITSKTTA